MANIVVRCEGCGKRYQISERLAGKRVKCKSCGAIMGVPASGGARGGGELSVAEPDDASLPNALTGAAADDPFAALSDDFMEPRGVGAPDAAAEAAASGIGRARLDFPHR